MLTGKPQLNRLINRRLVLDAIRRCGKISRAELTTRTEIPPPTITAVVKQLISEGLVEEIGPGQTNGGRLPRMIALVPNKPCALGFEVANTRIFATLCDLRGSVCEELQTSFKPTSPAQAVESMHRLGDKLLHNADIDWGQLQGVGVAVPGHLNIAEGLIRWSKVFKWRDVQLRQLCEQRWGVPTDVVNNASAGGMAAHFFDRSNSVRNLVSMHFVFQDPDSTEVGVGTGIIVEGCPYHGEFGAAGEITTPIVHPFALLDGAGGRRFRSLKEFTGALDDGVPEVQSAMERVLSELSTVVVHTVNLFEPGILSISCDTPPLIDVLLRHFQKQLDEHHLKWEGGRTKLVATSLGDFALARGAIVPSLQRIFHLPKWSYDASPILNR